MLQFPAQYNLRDPLNKPQRYLKLPYAHLIVTATAAIRLDLTSKRNCDMQYILDFMCSSSSELILL